MSTSLIVGLFYVFTILDTGPWL